MVRVWDLVVRLFHWSLVAAFAVAWLSAEEVQPLHEFAGYTVLALIAVRLVWGVVGSRHARFASFVRAPGAVLAYLRAMLRGREARHLGHNPAGAAMIVALLVCLTATGATGWLLEGSEEARPAAVATAEPAGEAYEREEGEDSALKEAHEVLANLSLLLVVVHLGGVVLASVRHHENLARAMLTGDKRAPGPGDIA